MIHGHQQRIIEEELNERGLTFKPLQIEMLDHICCDVEARMGEGMTFDDALRLTMERVAPDHFRGIQQDTMDAIQGRVKTTRWLSYAGLFFLYASVCFKALHLQFGGILLAAAFGCFVISLILPAVAGVRFNREKPGAIRVLAVVAGIALLTIGFVLRILGLSGGDYIILSAVLITLVAMVVNTIYVYRNATGEGNLMTFLHEKYSPGIERFLLILLIPAGAYKIWNALWHPSVFYGDLILLIVIFAAGIHLLVLFWRALERERLLQSPVVLIAILISIALLLPVFAGEFVPVKIRIVMILLYSIVAAWLTCKCDDKRWMSQIITIVVPLWFFLWAMIRLSVLPHEYIPYLFSIPVLLLMVAMAAIAPKNTIVRAYMILSLSGYLFEFFKDGSPYIIP